MIARVMLIGRTGCGKTTLCQRLAQQELRYQKTQTVQLVGDAIDTPGEYSENRGLLRGLIVTSADARQVLLLQSCTDQVSVFSPGMSAAFGRPVAGVVTKSDLAPTPQAIGEAIQLLELAGAQPIFVVSAATGSGMAELTDFLQALSQAVGAAPELRSFAGNPSAENREKNERNEV